MSLIIPIFLPHQGCPHQCSFCNQSSITGKSAKHAGLERVGAVIEEWLSHSKRKKNVQVAFYGGSFTCLARERQEHLLAAVQPYLLQGDVDSIRLSTRPDCIDEKTLSFLKSQGVQTVELGVQSMSDSVLRAAKRGHNCEESKKAAMLLKKEGFELGVQLLIGLPKETRRSFIKGIHEIVALKADFIRLYPLLVVAGSELAEKYRENVFQPFSLELAVLLAGQAKKIMVKAGIKVVRMGLQPSVSLERSILAGPYHPSFGELVNGRIWLKKVKKLFSVYPTAKKIVVKISQKDQSAFWGLKGCNRDRLQTLGIADRLQVHLDNTVERGTMDYVVY